MLGLRIKEARKIMGMSREDLAQSVGLTVNAIGGYERGEREPTLEKVERIAEVLRVDVAYFYTGHNVRLVPILSRVQADDPIYTPEDVEGLALAPAETGGSSNSTLFYLRVQDDSMDQARIGVGDLVLVRRQEILDDGDVGVVEVAGSTMIRRFYYSGTGVLLKAENPAARPQALGKRSVKIIGKVLQALITVE